ncbi:hypothetical protein VB834_11715 [Limnoraphis robusta Tam1]|jgi:hypothetical protein|uniref:Lipoyl synthase n=1 Tax=Limnoraphis robusta CCNP1315 TaxID=3110306 RepID=A0ABU5TZR4_9CYAN|nr:hypothetical protein [Limnoraphis robusta]MCG5059680.1 hypothetical protein [Limnoraphis sp. WC205]MEA5519918.1 hypothetical protein [Limnoraphis robusta CCNP1315]MEA5539698.1 hypothetical protein [Limnoraphis robusta Tam1]MEA5545158.1 hypothetical protein [Limnoraphis robusta CCNP1324]
MMKNLLKSSTIFRLSLAFVTILIVWQLFSSAQASTNSQLEFRIRRLETQIGQLRGEISGLRSRSSPSVNIVEVPPVENIPPDPRSHLMSGDPMFDRLATLVIELKQDFQQLQQRVDQIESQTET